MAEVIGVRFKSAGKMYYFDPIGMEFPVGSSVIVETSRGVECGTVVLKNREVREEEIVSPLKPIIREATEQDLRIVARNREKEKEAFQICQQKIEKRKLVMKLIDVEYTFDGNKILFYFTADGRVDFRELVKDLASVFRTRIELRQIGVRDESKMLGGLGMCGRPFCCSSFLGDFQPVSIKMAKEQGLSLNPSKISGTCGRLMCCLKYEQDVYEELLKLSPKIGAVVKTPEGKGVVVDTNLLTGMLTVRLDESPYLPQTFHKRDVSLIKDAQIRVEQEEIAAFKNLEDTVTEESREARPRPRNSRNSRASKDPGDRS